MVSRNDTEKMKTIFNTFVTEIFRSTEFCFVLSKRDARRICLEITIELWIDPSSELFYFDRQKQIIHICLLFR